MNIFAHFREKKVAFFSKKTNFFFGTDFCEFLQLENEKLRSLIDDNIYSNEILARVMLDRESPFLRTIILNKGTKDNIKMGMAIKSFIN